MIILRPRNFLAFWASFKISFSSLQHPIYNSMGLNFGSIVCVCAEDKQRRRCLYSPKQKPTAKFVGGSSRCSDSCHMAPARLSAKPKERRLLQLETELLCNTSLHKRIYYNILLTFMIFWCG